MSAELQNNCARPRAGPKQTDDSLARKLLRLALALFYAGAGYLHLTVPEKFLLITPAWVPDAPQVIFVTGLCEIAGASGLLLPPLRRLSGAMLALYAICVFPANIKHAVEAIVVPGLPTGWWYHAPRLVRSSQFWFGARSTPRA